MSGWLGFYRWDSSFMNRERCGAPPLPVPSLSCGSAVSVDAHSGAGFHAGFNFHVEGLLSIEFHPSAAASGVVVAS